MSFVTCPVCKVNCSTSQIIDQRFIMEKKENSTSTNSNANSPEQLCNNCGDGNVVTAWCSDCALRICDVCVQAHQR